VKLGIVQGKCGKCGKGSGEAAEALSYAWRILGAR